jgi:hypothetical protein
MCGPAYQTRVENGSVTQRFQMGGNGFHLKPDLIELARELHLALFLDGQLD